MHLLALLACWCVSSGCYYDEPGRYVPYYAPSPEHHAPYVPRYEPEPPPTLEELRGQREHDHELDSYRHGLTPVGERLGPREQRLGD